MNRFRLRPFYQPRNNSMRIADKLRRRHLFLIAVVLLASSAIKAQPASTGAVRGRVVDQLGGLIVGASVSVTDGKGISKNTNTGGEGAFLIAGLSTGRYVMRITAPGFSPYENIDVEVTAGRITQLDIRLMIGTPEAKVTVLQSELSVDVANNANALVLSGKQLDALPDDPDELAATLQLLAGPAAGPDGAQIYLDGFQSGRLPPKQSIREVRINQDPFSAEHDHLGLGRVEIFTKPGTTKLHGQGAVYFNDESMDSRNPFAPRRAPFQELRSDGNLSGPLIPKKATYFIDFNWRKTDDNGVINASVLDPAFNVAQLNEVILEPQRRGSFSPRIDYQLNAKNTLIARYTYARGTFKNDGVGGFSLATQGYSTTSTQESGQVTLTSVLNTAVNEARFQFVRERRTQTGNSFAPTIIVREAFVGGGSRVGIDSNTQDRWELQDYASWFKARHALKAGIRLRGIQVTDSTQLNFNGTFVFDSLAQYRDVLLSKPGTRPAQFLLSGGNPTAQVGQTDFGGFIQDAIRPLSGLGLSFGLRYETQTNIHDWTDFAPRFAFAWAPGARGSQQPKTIIRGGFGLFYDRVSELQTLQARRFDGRTQQRFNILSPDFFPLVPSLDSLAHSASQFATTQRLAADLRTPYATQTALGIEHQLPSHMVLSATFINTRSLHLLRSRDVNAFLPGTFPDHPAKPLGLAAGQVFLYESSGRLKQNQLVVKINNQFNSRFAFYATYTLSKAKSDTDGPDTFPINSYNLASEFGRSAFDVRHRLAIGGSVTAPWKIVLSPLIIANSGFPYNITTGIDSNGDEQFTERPAFAADRLRPGIVSFAGALLDPNPTPEEQLIPRNFGSGPPFVMVNARLSKTIDFGQKTNTAGRTPAATSESRFNVTFSLQVQNLFNHTNPGTPIGNIRSPLFAKSNALASAYSYSLGLGSTTAGNRRVEVRVRFAF